MKQILIFVMLSTMMCWFMFSPIYKHVTIMRQAVLQKEVDFLLEIGANGTHGYIDEAMIALSKQRLEERGFTESDLLYSISTTSGAEGSNPESPVLRGIGIKLKITYPYENLFLIDRLVGMEIPAAGARMGAAGMKMSEYVP
jgi:hypothetical protein